MLTVFKLLGINIMISNLFRCAFRCDIDVWDINLYYNIGLYSYVLK